MKSESGIFKHIFVALAVFLSVSKVSAQQDKIITKYNNETEITAPRRITFKSGFVIPFGKKVKVYTTGITFKQCTAFLGAPSTDQNYVSTRVFKTSGVNQINLDAARTTCEVNQTIQYFDGLGRPFQMVTTQGSPTFKDVVQPVVYDAFGRETIKYQPYATNDDSNGTYKADALIKQASYYGQSSWDANVVKMANPYSQTVFEDSPLNRVVEQGFPGSTWQVVSQSSAGHTVKMEYGANDDDDEVKLWVITANGAKSTSNYLSEKLSKATSKSENWISGKAGTVDEYKDLEGHIVLKRIWENETKSVSTYYLYDDLGNLSYVLPPAVNKNGQNPLSGFDEGDVAFKQFIYGYHYDGRKRLTKKKIPGKGWELMVYNKLDQVILAQDANQKDKEWFYTKYDALGRVVSSGIYSSAASQVSLQATVDGESIFWETRSGTDYSNLAFPQSGASPYGINYYDNYAISGLPNNQSESYSKQVKNLLTATKIKVLGTAGDYLWTVNYYDEEARVVKIYKQHYLGGKVNAANYDEIENTYSFGGELLASKKLHHSENSITTIANRYEYDHMGRKKATFESINGEAEVALNKLDYNEIGQLQKKLVHSTDGTNFLENSTYTYNERGWLKKNTASLFSYELKYEDGTTPQFDGNISNQYWGVNGTNPNIYTYSYDKLNRLTNGTSTGISMSEALTYDEMGNIQSLKRDGALGTYGYTGNQLNKVTGDFSTGVYSYDASGNTIIDGRNGVTLTYNHLNLPSIVTRVGLNMAYTYNTAGSRLRKISNSEVRDYIDGIEYNAGVIDVIHTEEGLARRNGTKYSYEYNLTDHLGNVRLSFYKNPVSGVLETIQKDDYYPFGQRKVVSAGQNKYLYNGKELQEELGQFDYGARFYDPVIGRWNVIDPLAEKMRRFSPYNYGFNNPIRFVDPDGMEGLVWDFSNRKTQNMRFVDPDGGGPGPTGTPILGLPLMKLFLSYQKSIMKMGMNNVASVLNTISNANNAGMAKGKVKEEYTAAANQGVNDLAVGFALGEATGGLLGQISKGLKGAAVGTAEAAASKAANGSVYSVAFETELSSALYPGKGYYTHFKAANTSLSETMASDASFSSSMSDLGVSVPRSPTGNILGKSPADWVWHHDIGNGVMQLVPKTQHTTGSFFWDTMHPNGVGGMAIWGR